MLFVICCYVKYISNYYRRLLLSICSICFHSLHSPLYSLRACLLVWSLCVLGLPPCAVYTLLSVGRQPFRGTPSVSKGGGQRAPSSTCGTTARQRRHARATSLQRRSSRHLNRGGMLPISCSACAAAHCQLCVQLTGTRPACDIRLQLASDWPNNIINAEYTCT